MPSAIGIAIGIEAMTKGGTQAQRIESIAGALMKTMGDGEKIMPEAEAVAIRMAKAALYVVEGVNVSSGRDDETLMVGYEIAYAAPPDVEAVPPDDGLPPEGGHPTDVLVPVDDKLNKN